MEEYSEEKKEEIFSNAYIPPEIIKSNRGLTSRVDSWVFGVILFNILFGHSPISYYIQLKNWRNYYYRQNMTKEIYDLIFLNPIRHFQLKFLFLISQIYFVLFYYRHYIYVQI